jgi:uncharacterized membrane protein
MAQRCKCSITVKNIRLLTTAVEINRGLTVGATLVVSYGHLYYQKSDDKETRRKNKAGLYQI